MSLYNDYKKSKNTDSIQNKIVEETDGKFSVDETSDSISIGDEVYTVFNEPFYKKKGFYTIVAIILVIIGVLAVVLYVPKFTMEDLVGKEADYASAYADNYDMKFVSIDEYNDNTKSGIIFEQSLKAGEEYKEGSVLKVKISKGPDYEIVIEYPDFSNMTYEQASQWQKDNHAKGTKLVVENNEAVESGGYIREELGKDTQKNNFKRNSETTVYYSKGPAPETNVVTVPDFSTKTVNDVALWGRQNNIVIETNEIFDDYIVAGMILEQSVKAGGKLNKGSTLSIGVSAGKGVVVPYFGNYTAEKAVAQADLTVTTSSVYSSNIPAGKFISQSIPSGTITKAANPINVVYSLGLVPIGNYTGMSYPDATAAINELNSKGAGITIKISEIDGPEEAIPGTVASHNHTNNLIVVGSEIVLVLYR